MPTDRSRLALAAIIPAALVPILLPALQRSSASDAVTGGIAGVLLGLSILLLIAAVRRRRTC